jgi:hypothetical protein
MTSITAWGLDEILGKLVVTSQQVRRPRERAGPRSHELVKLRLVLGVPAHGHPFTTYDAGTGPPGGQ